MATQKLSYEDYLKRVQPGMLNSGRQFLGPQSGVNFALEGLTPEQAYANAQPFDYEQIDGRDIGAMNASRETMLDPTWKKGPSGNGIFENFGNLASEIGKNPALMGAVLGGAAQYFNVPGFTGEQGFSGMGGQGGSMGAAGDFGLNASLGGGDVAALNGNQIAALNPAATGGGFSFATPDIMTAGTGLDLGAIGTTATPAGAAAGFSGIGGGTGGAAGIGSGTTLGGASAAGGGGLGGLFDKATNYLSDPGNLLKVGGTVLGALGGAAASGDTTTSNSSNRDPWKEAQPYLIDNLKTNAAMQEHYRANPFSDLQKQQYQGLFNNLANAQANVPGLLANANAFGQSKRGVMPPMTGLLSGTQAAPIDWSQYQNIGRK